MEHKASSVGNDRNQQSGKAMLHWNGGQLIALVICLVEHITAYLTNSRYAEHENQLLELSEKFVERLDSYDSPCMRKLY